MSERRRTVAHVSCVHFADRLSVKPRHWVVVGRHGPTSVRCIVQGQLSGRPTVIPRQAWRSPLGPKPVERWTAMMPMAVGRILGIGLDLVAPSTPRSSGACPSAQVGETSEMSGSGMVRTAGALLG